MIKEEQQTIQEKIKGCEKMICTNNKISKIQLAAIVLNSVIGVEILSLPNVLANQVGTDGWLVIIIAGMIAVLLTWMINSIAVKYPGKSMVEFGRELVPTPLANVISLIYMVEFVIIGGVILKFFNEIIGVFLLSRTPFQVINITILLLAVYMVRSGIQSMGRLFIISTAILAIPTIVIGLSIIPDINVENYFPIMNTSATQILKNIPKSLNAFSGFQILFFITFLVKEDKKHTKKYNALAIASTILIYLSIYMISLGKYGENKLKHQLWPLMSLMRSVQIPSAFLENIDALVLSVWIVSVFTSLAVVLYGSSFIFSRLLKTDEMKPFVIPLAAAIYMIGSLPENLAEKIGYSGKILNVTSSVTIIIVPILYFVIMKIKEKRGVKTSE